MKVISGKVVWLVGEAARVIEETLSIPLEVAREIDKDVKMVDATCSMITTINHATSKIHEAPSEASNATHY